MHASHGLSVLVGKLGRLTWPGAAPGEGAAHMPLDHLGSTAHLGVCMAMVTGFRIDFQAGTTLAGCGAPGKAIEARIADARAAAAGCGLDATRAVAAEGLAAWYTTCAQ